MTLKQLGALLHKEAFWSRHNLMALFFLLLLLPGSFAYTTTAFGDVLPDDAPVAVAPQDETVTDTDIDVTKAAITTFSAPRSYESVEQAKTALAREEVYAIVSVPPDVTTSDSLQFTIYVDGSIVPYHEPADAITSIVDFYLQQSLDGRVDVDRTVIGSEQTLSEYLVPVGLMLITLLLAFAYLPYNLAREQRVLDRVRLTTSLRTVVGSKLIFFTGLLLIPLFVFQFAIAYLEYNVTVVTLPLLGIYILTFLYLAMISTSVMFLTKFSALGRFLNIVVLFGVLMFSNLIYPAGFFSPLRREIARLSPLHYSMIIARSEMLKDVPVSLFADWLLALGGFTLAAVLGLHLSITYYTRTVAP